MGGNGIPVLFIVKVWVTDITRLLILLRVQGSPNFSLSALALLGLKALFGVIHFWLKFVVCLEVR